MKHILMILTLLLAAPGGAFAGELLNRTYQLKVRGGTFSCREGIPPNGNNFPIYTSLEFELQSFNLWLGNVWTNVDRYSAHVDYRPCSDFARLLKPRHEQDLIGTVNQRITESYRLNGFKDCMRETREEATLTVDGVEFRGVSTFLVGPVKKELCEAP